MSGVLWKELSRVFRSVLQKAAEPPSEVCLFCGSRTGIGRSNPLGICSTCMDAIPWIKDVRCEICGRYEPCSDCKRRTDAYFVRNRSAVRYDETMKAWLAKYKYRGDEKLGRLLGGMLVHAYRLYPADLKFDLVTYVPLSEGRLEERGFNQAERLAGSVGAAAGIRVVPMLVRVRNTAKQSFKTRRERLQDMGGAFEFDPAMVETISRMQAVRKRKLRILVVDDVYTTGSTLNQCAYAIRQSVDVDVYGLCWAR